MEIFHFTLPGDVKAFDQLQNLSVINFNRLHPGHSVEMEQDQPNLAPVLVQFPNLLRVYDLDGTVQKGKRLSFCPNLGNFVDLNPALFWDRVYKQKDIKNKYILKTSCFGIFNIKFRETLFSKFLKTPFSIFKNSLRSFFIFIFHFSMIGCS